MSQSATGIEQVWQGSIKKAASLQRLNIVDRSVHLLPYNPLDPRNISESIAKALLERDVNCLCSIPKFYGAGIYVLYYRGRFFAYYLIAKDEFTNPIYIGKAVPEGARKGRVCKGAGDSTELWERLNEHA